MTSVGLNLRTPVTQPQQPSTRALRHALAAAGDQAVWAPDHLFIQTARSRLWSRSRLRERTWFFVPEPSGISIVSSWEQNAELSRLSPTKEHKQWAEKVRASKPKRIYAPRIVSDHVMVQEDFERLHKFLLETECLSEVFDDMRELVEEEWPELVHKLPPKVPQSR
jgi:hypothetical protein